MVNCFVPSALLSGICTIILILSFQLGFAEVRSSDNFKLQSDSINFGGGLSSSDSFRQESTLGEIATGDSASATYQLRAGYQQMQEIFLSMTAPDTVELPPLLGLTGGESTGSTTVTVTTDSPAGYTLSIASQNTPAMQSLSSSIADYEHGIDADYSFIISPGTARFGFSPFGDDIVPFFRNNGSLCGVGSLITPAACWSGLSTTSTIIAQQSGANHPNGVDTTLFFRVGIGNNAGVLAGVYTATTTITALPL